MSLGRRRSPFAAYNPFLRASRSIRSSNIALPTPAAFSFGLEYTSTTTGAWETFESRTFDIPFKAVYLLWVMHIHVKHSVANAIWNHRLIMHVPTDGTSGTTVLQHQVGPVLLAPIADTYSLFAMSAPAGFISTVAMNPGLHLAEHQFWSQTAGTITLSSGSQSSDFYSLFLIPSTSAL